MITVFNAQNYAQQWFFDKAFALLWEKGKLNQAEKDLGRFLSLEGYFAHLDELVLTDPVYVLIPTDEEPFEINANARTITIPAAFNKCTGVVGDTMSEIVTFTIDRYFDYVDLGNAHICIQWKVPGDEPNTTKEGISHISLIDRDTYPGKIRFGWPLTSELTKKAGNVSFSVRFFMKNKEDEFVYLLNTLPASFAIRDGLNITAPKVEEEDIHSLFGQFVQRSLNPTYPTPAPVYFNDNPGLNLKSQEKIDKDNDTLELMAQALVSDNGHINYNWYFKKDAKPDMANRDFKYTPADEWSAEKTYFYYDAEKQEFVQAQPMTKEEFEKKTYYVIEPLVSVRIDETDKRFKITEEYIPFETQPTTRDGSEQYFTYEDNPDGLKSYKLWTAPQLPTDKTLYQRYTKLQIMPINTLGEDEGLKDSAKEVTGLYWVGATNYVGNDKYTVKDKYDPTISGEIHAANYTNEIKSAYCYIPTPNEILVKHDLIQDVFIDKQPDESMKAILHFDVETDSGDPYRTFTWYCNPEKEEFNTKEDYIVAQAKDKDSLETETPGWYYTNVLSELNRKETTVNSKVISRVINHPEKPVITSMSYALWTDSAKADPEAYFANERNWTTIYTESMTEEDILSKVMGEDVAEQGDILRLRITTNLDGEKRDRGGLLTDDLTYDWYVIEPDGERPLGQDDIDRTNNGYLVFSTSQDSPYIQLGENQIDIRCKVNNKKCSFYCQIRNDLANEHATLELSDYKAMFNVY